jgi:hypothetical protein
MQSSEELTNAVGKAMSNQKNQGTHPKSIQNNPARGATFGGETISARWPMICRCLQSINADLHTTHSPPL